MALARYDAAIEFTVTTDGPFPVRALGPALYVGQTAVIESEQVEGERYRFLAFEPDALEEGAPIALGWSARSTDRRETRFRFERPPHKGPAIGGTLRRAPDVRRMARTRRHLAK